MGTIISICNMQPARFYQTLRTYTANPFHILEDQRLLIPCRVKPLTFQKKKINKLTLFSEIYEN